MVPGDLLIEQSSLVVGRYELELEGFFYVIRDRFIGELVRHRTLLVPERYRSERRARRRLAELEAEIVAVEPGDAPGGSEGAEGGVR